MNFLTIIVYNQGKEIGRCNNTSLNVKAYESIREFTFRNYKVSVPQSFDNSGYSYINFSMYMETKSGNSRELSKLKILPASEANFEKNGDVKVYGHLIPDRSIDYYNQYEVDILHSWSEGWEVNWHSPMISIEQKQALLRMRGFYSGVPHSIRGKEGELNGSDIFHFEDFYQKQQFRQYCNCCPRSGSLELMYLL